MPILPLLIGWILFSIPVTLIVGRVIREPQTGRVPGWSTEDELQLEQWRTTSDH